MDFEKIADALIALNNASPYSPTKDQIIEVLRDQRPAQPPDVVIGGCALGASITVIDHARIAWTGWQIGIREGSAPTGDDIAVALLDYIKAAVTAKKPEPGRVLN